MSGKRPKGLAKPHQRVTETKPEPASDATPTGETPPPLTATPVLEGRLPVSVYCNYRVALCGGKAPL